MATNVYFNPKVRSEQNLYEDIIIESIKMYGQDVYYLPREIITRDMLLGEDIESQFDDAYIVEMYIENTEGFEGEGNIFQKFGMEIRDEATFVVSRRQWEKRVGIFENREYYRPAEGDLIYLPLSKSFFEISFVEHEQPFYQLSNLPVYKLNARLFEFSGEDFNTDIADIDRIEAVHGYQQTLLVQDINGSFTTGDRVTQTLTYDGNDDPLAQISAKIVSFQELGTTSGYLYVTDIQTNDGEFHEFAAAVGDADRRITGTDVYGDIAEVIDVANSQNLNGTFTTDPNATNWEFEQEADDILDFSESNPFGEPS